MGRFLVLLLMIHASALSGARYTLLGVVTDQVTREPLAAANIRVSGTSRGTIANERGEYALLLDSGLCTLIFSSLGYRADTVHITVSAGATCDVELLPADITLPEVVITADDPAIGIIRRAIASKHLWIDRLTSYSFTAFTRQTLFRDTAIASITESFTNGYWRQGDTLREVVTQRRQTENIRPDFNFASVGRILNFNDDEIRFAGYMFVGPTALDALAYYDYKLIRTYTIRGRDVYEIRMIPKTRTVPLFKGTVTIAADSYALAGIDVEPNEAFQLPFVRMKSIRYRQQFGLYDSLYWMPADIRIDASVSIAIIGFEIPPISIRQTSVITDYGINPAIPDSVFAKPRLVVDSTAMHADSVFWASNVVLPLNATEREAYRTLDSSKTLDVQFRPGGIGMTLGVGDSSGIVGTGLSSIDFTFNRVEGLHLGAAGEFDSLFTRATFDLGAAYGFSRKRWTYTAGATIYPFQTRRTFGIGASLYRIVDNVPDQGYYSSGTVGIGALLGKVDYRDYFSAAGWKLFVTSSPRDLVFLKAGYTAENQSSEQKRTDYSLFYPSRKYRGNLPIRDGLLRSISGWVRIGPEAVPLDLVTQNSLEIAVEHASPSLLAGDFRFTRILGVLSFSVPTFGTSYLFPPSLRLRVAGGSSSGPLPPQRIFSIETQLDGYAPFGVMRAGEARELTGTRMFSVNIEHNFRSLPFLALGIPFLYRNNIELIMHGGAARVWGAPDGSAPSTRIWYIETGLGISRIFELFRTDFTWRLSRPPNFFFTVGVAQIL